MQENKNRSSRFQYRGIYSSFPRRIERETERRKMGFLGALRVAGESKAQGIKRDVKNVEVVAQATIVTSPTISDQPSLDTT